eukprot:365661-Chlamydomonas_euryale.AAC.4
MLRKVVQLSCGAAAARWRRVLRCGRIRRVQPSPWRGERCPRRGGGTARTPSADIAPPAPRRTADFGGTLDCGGLRRSGVAETRLRKLNEIVFSAERGCIR